VQQVLHLGKSEHVGAIAKLGNLVDAEWCLSRLQQVALDGLVE
jgi:hypothetical protein